MPTDQEQRQAKEEQLAADLAEQEAKRNEEQARKAHEAALAAARRARTEAERDLASRLATIQEISLGMAKLGAELASRRADEADIAQERITREVAFYAKATDPALSGPAAMELFRKLDLALAKAHSDLRRALRVRASPSRLPESLPGPGTMPSDVSLRERYAEVATAASELAKKHEKLGELERRLKYRQATDTAEEVLRLGRIRALLVGKLSAPDRRDLVGLGHPGLRAMRRELDHTVLVLRWTPSAWRESFSPSIEGRTNLDAIGKTTVAVGELLLLLVLWLFLRARWRGWVTAAGPMLAAEVNNVALRQLVATALRITLALGDELLLVAMIHAVGNLLVGDNTPAELAALYAVAVTYAWYRLILQATDRYLRSAATMRGVTLTEATEERIISSLRLAGRYSFAVVAAVVFVDHVVGDGFLATWLRRLFWAGAAIILVVLLRRWRDAITNAYLENFPRGGLADLVRRTRNSSAGTVVAVAAFVYVAVRGITLYLRDVAMRFEHTRRGLAYLFRLRLERHVDRLGTGTVQLEDLPAPVLQLFSEPTAPDTPLVDGWRGMDETVGAITAWLAGGAAPDVLLYGPVGVGRSTWLDELERRVEAKHASPDRQWRITRIHFTRRVTSEADLCAMLSESLGLPATTRVKDLMAELREQPRQLLLVDDIQLVMLRSMDGLGALRAFAEIVVGTLDHSLWVCTCTLAAWRFTSSVMRGRNVFARTVELTAWREERIRELVVGRMEKAGVTAVYDDLVIDQLDTGLAEGMRAAERFHRLLWDHADGNPREAMRVWLRSLVPDADGRVRVRLFSTADPDELESLGELSKFMLATIVHHDHITIADASRALGEPPRDCRMTLAWLAAQGYAVS